MLITIYYRFGTRKVCMTGCLIAGKLKLHLFFDFGNIFVYNCLRFGAAATNDFSYLTCT